MSKDSLEDVSGTPRDSIIDDKVYKRKPITIGDWAELIIKFRTLLRIDAYKIEDLHIRYMELERIDAKNIDRGSVRMALSRDDIAKAFFFKVFSGNEGITEDNVLAETIGKLDTPDQIILLNAIMNDSVPQQEGEGGASGNP